MFELMENHSEEAVIKVIGVGGGGGNAVEYMVASNIEGVEFVAANTDAQALRNSSANITLQLGANVTKGLGAGANPEIGRRSAEEDRETIKKTIQGADMVFIAAGMGGGTGTGAAPIVAEVARELGILTVAVVTKPFPFEGKKRTTFADEGILELSKHVDSLITIPNDKLLKVLGKGNKERLIPLHPQLVGSIKKFIETKRSEIEVQEGSYLLVTTKGKKLSAPIVYNCVKKHLSLVTTIDKRSPHVMRHTFATHLLNNGADINAVKELLGHSSLAATQVYTHNTIEKLKAVYAKAHPKA